MAQANRHHGAKLRSEGESDPVHGSASKGPELLVFGDLLDDGFDTANGSSVCWAAGGIVRRKCHESDPVIQGDPIDGSRFPSVMI
jgi:hypothetical protein